MLKSILAKAEAVAEPIVKISHLAQLPARQII
jgi:hypothetical protein